MGILDFLIEIYYEIGTYAPIIQVAVASIIFSVIITISMFIYLSVIRYKHQKNINKKNQIRPQIEKLFKDILFGDTIYHEDEIYTEYTKIVGKLSARKIKLAIDVLLELKFNSPEKSRRYQSIVDALRFETYLEKKLDFSRGSTKMKTLQKLQQLDLKSLDSKVLNYAYSKNKELRREARYSHLQLSENDPYRFLDEIKGELTYWDEINLLKFLKIHNEKNELSNLGKWINYSEHDSLTVFLIKAAGLFEQIDTKEIINKKTKSKNIAVRTEAYKTLGKLKASEFEPKLIERFFSEKEECQLAIVNSIGLMNTGNAVSFLKKAYLEAKSISLKKEIALVSFTYKSNYNLFEDLKATQNGFDRTIFNHIETQLIKFK
ncbi:HEAT repeat domain-containing protein [Aquimarina celericrescens]|nr:HEAT repeat domain-containing protein [Aquimarina celericrescens]